MAKDEMFVHTDIPEAPWYVVEGDDKRRARLNCIAHLLSITPYEDVIEPPLELPPRPGPGPYERPPRELFRCDALLVRVRPNGPACHTGSLSCFAPALWRTIAERATTRPQGSYTTELLDAGTAA